MIRSAIAMYKSAYLGMSSAMWWLALVMLVNRAGTMVLPFMTVYLREEMHFTIAAAGFAIAFFGAGAILGNFVGGKLTDRIGFSQVQFWALFLNGVLFILLGLMHTFWQIAAGMFVIGLVGEAFRPANASAIAHYSLPENRTRSYSLNRLAINLGFSIGPAIGGLLSFQYLFWVDGITCMLAALLLRVALPAEKKDTEKSEAKMHVPVTNSVWKDKVYLQFMFFVFLTALCFLQLFSMVPVYYKEVFHLDKSIIGLVLGLNGFIIVVIEMVLVFKLEGRRSPVQYISAGAFFIGLSYLFLNIPLPGLALAVFAMCTITIGEMFMFPFINTFWISRSNDRNRGQYASVFSMSFACAQVIAPTFGSQVVQRAGYQVLWYTIFGLSAIATLGFYNFRKHHK